MKTEINTNFDKFTFEAKRLFKAPIALVWKAYTEPNLIDQWWAPKPWKAETKSMDFKPEGKWVYDMVGPEGERHSAIQIFNEIETENSFSGIDAFTDEDGNINDSMPVAKWKNTFQTTDEGTLVIAEAIYPSAASLKTVIDMGMEQGLSMAHDNLAELLLRIEEK